MIEKIKSIPAKLIGDDRVRCHWPKSDLDIVYHDQEWGVPLHHDRKLF